MCKKRWSSLPSIFLLNQCLCFSAKNGGCKYNLLTQKNFCCEFGQYKFSGFNARSNMLLENLLESNKLLEIPVS